MNTIFKILINAKENKNLVLKNGDVTIVKVMVQDFLVMGGWYDKREVLNLILEKIPYCHKCNNIKIISTVTPSNNYVDRHYMPNPYLNGNTEKYHQRVIEIT